MADKRPRQVRGELSRETILETAVRIADEKSLAELSLRQVAARLGVTPMALYHHVGGIQELHQHVAGVVLQRMLPKAEDLEVATWREALIMVAQSMYSMLTEYPTIGEIFNQRPDLPELLFMQDVVYRALSSAGLGGPRQVLFIHAYNGLIKHSAELCIAHRKGATKELVDFHYRMSRGDVVDEYPFLTTAMANIPGGLIAVDKSVGLLIELVESYVSQQDHTARSPGRTGGKH